MRGFGFGVAIVLAGMLMAASAHATFPGRNGEIVFSWADWSGKQISGSSGVDAYDPRRKSRRRVALCNYNQGETPFNCHIGDSATSPDGRSVAMVVSEPPGSGPFALPTYRLSIVGRESRTFSLPGPAFDLAWAPAGDSLLVTLYDGPEARYRQGPVRVAHYTLDGRELPAVVGPGASDADWSSNGEIVFVKDGRLWVTRPGGSVRQVTSEGGTTPSWSAHGARLAFTRDGGIWTARADGSQQRRLTRGAGTSPAWSPDGGHIAFVRPTENDGAGSIWTMRSDGCRPHALVTFPGASLGANDSPSWRSVPGRAIPPKPSACAKARQKAKRRAALQKAKRQTAAKQRRLLGGRRANSSETGASTRGISK
jgi:Tol biopolymer transport system component